MPVFLTVSLKKKHPSALTSFLTTTSYMLCEAKDRPMRVQERRPGMAEGSYFVSGHRPLRDVMLDCMKDVPNPFLGIILDLESFLRFFFRIFCLVSLIFQFNAFSSVQNVRADYLNCFFLYFAEFSSRISQGSVNRHGSFTLMTTTLKS